MTHFPDADGAGGERAQLAVFERAADGLPGRTFDGAIDFIYPTVSNETRTLKARLSLDNGERVLRPGMYGQVDVASRRGGAPLVVPAESVVNTGSSRAGCGPGAVTATASPCSGVSTRATRWSRAHRS